MPFRVPSGHAVTPGGQGRFPGFDVLDEVDRWDDVTAGVVLARLDPQPDYSFFTPAEQATADALFDRLLAQDRAPKVPVLLLVDRRLALDQTDGWHYEDLPEDTTAWRQSLAALDDDARSGHNQPFHHLGHPAQGSLVQAVHDVERWHGWPSSQIWSLWTRYACTAFYSHPWAWNEIGFGGPAYPRGYKALGVDKREGWEVADHHSVDPIRFSERVDRARAAHAEIAASSRAEVTGDPVQ
ncbi:MAG: gluconate 2-dehydrogenase subunit 3 family protein [Actinomycetota bacterium]|nr:gluconate 2-dehydrogenase subunit 3 family protein [Actinomycetota bacterium]